MNPLIKQLIEARKQQGISQAALGQKMGLPQSHLSKIEQGNVNLRLSSLLDMARLLGFELVLIPKAMAPALNSILSPASEDEEEKSLPQMILADYPPEVH